MTRLFAFVAVLICLAGNIFGQVGMRSPAFVANLYAPSTGAATWSSNNMTLWLVSDDLTAIGDNTAPVLWTNRISGRMHFTNTTGNAVVKSNNIVNSKSGLCFNGSTGSLTAVNTADGITATNWNAFIAANQCMMFVVMRQHGAQANNGLMGWQSTARIGIFATYSDVLYFDYGDVSANRISNSQPGGWDDAWHVLTVWRDTSKNAKIRVDGVDIASGTLADDLTDAGIGSAWTIGVDPSATYAQVDIAEFRIFNVYSSGEVSLNEQNLKTTYNTP